VDLLKYYLVLKHLKKLKKPKNLAEKEQIYKESR
jgi:hypothetical protein